MDLNSTIKKEIKTGDWLEEDILTLVELYNKGYSYGKIAEVVGRSRNAIAGQMTKVRGKGTYGIGPMRVRPGSRKLLPQTVKVKLQQKAPVRRPPVLGFKKPPTPILDVVIADSAPVTLINLKPHHCKYPIGDPRDEEFRYCGKTRKSNHPYCAEHHRATVQPFPVRRPTSGHFRASGGR